MKISNIFWKCRTDARDSQDRISVVYKIVFMTVVDTSRPGVQGRGSLAV